jgi:hypothetical protein
MSVLAFVLSAMQSTLRFFGNTATNTVQVLEEAYALRADMHRRYPGLNED